MKRHNKQSIISQYQDRRRSEALSRQRAARRDLTAQVRQLALSEHSHGAFSINFQGPAPGDQSPATATSSDAQERELPSVFDAHGLGLRAFYSKQLMQHEWLTDIPRDLAHNWLVLPRPEGQRCLVVASRQHTITRTRSGSILHSFASPLPGGSKAAHGSPEAFSILDTIFSEPDNTFFVIDMMAWNGYLLYDCNAEFRMFWVQSKLAEIAGLDARQSSFHFAPVTVHPCNPEGIQAAYSGNVPFQVRDGLLFLNKEGHYDLGTSPLALLWKDVHISRFFVDTDAAGIVPERQHLVLQYLDNGRVGTGDEPPVIIGTVPQDVLLYKQDNLR